MTGRVVVVGLSAEVVVVVVVVDVVVGSAVVEAMVQLAGALAHWLANHAHEVMFGGIEPGTQLHVDSGVGPTARRERHITAHTTACMLVFTSCIWDGMGRTEGGGQLEAAAVALEVGLDVVLVLVRQAAPAVPQQRQLLYGINIAMSSHAPRLGGVEGEHGDGHGELDDEEQRQQHHVLRP